MKPPHEHCICGRCRVAKKENRRIKIRIYQKAYYRKKNPTVKSVHPKHRCTACDRVGHNARTCRVKRGA